MAICYNYIICLHLENEVDSMDIKQIKLNIETSPRAVDELKIIYSKKKCSKYQLPLILLPEELDFPADISIVDNMVWINIICEEISILLKGKLDGKEFQCRSVSRGSVTNGRKINLSFVHKISEEFFHINPQLKKRLDMWYNYINIMLKKSRDNTYVFTFEEILTRNNDRWRIRVSGKCEYPQLKNMNVGIADDKNEPSFSFGKVEQFENEILIIKIERQPGVILTEGRTKIAVYDAASHITAKRMKNGLDKLCRGEAVNKRLTDFLFNPSAANIERGDNITLSLEDLLMKTMNTEQLAAVEGVLNAKDLYLIQGPPGTGKTTVIAEICYQNAVRGLKTLVVSQSNLAVDNAISRVMNHNEIRVLRKGNASRVEDEGLPFVEDNVVHTWINCVCESSGKMAVDINLRLDGLKKNKDRLPEILKYAEDVRENFSNKDHFESQVFFYKNVLDEADTNREKFLELINEAYENENEQRTYDARNFYPADFKIPNNIYNDISEKFSDIESDVKKIHELEQELEMLNEYTEKFVRQMNFINRHVSNRIMENFAYEGIFYYTDKELADNLYTEGEGIIKSIPYGIKSIVFRPKWGRVAAIYYRRAESFVTGIQHRTIKLCAKIHLIENNEEFRFNVEAFRLSLDALCQDYDSQYYTIKMKYDNIRQELHNIIKEYDYSVELFREKISDKFFSAAIGTVSAKNPVLCEIECSVNEYYSAMTQRYLKWLEILEQWREKISGNDVNYNALKQLYIENANVIGITCIQSGTVDFERNYPSFDVVIIDESSKSTPPDIILPMLKGKKIVLVGDHKQLPPYIDSDAYDEVSEDNSNQHELMKVSLFEELYESAPSDMKTMLFRQYRMHRDIAGMINQFYKDTDAGRLESPSEAPKNHYCQGDTINERNHILWYDIKNIPEHYEAKQNKSYYNMYEVKCIKNILGMINSNLSANGSRKSVGVITFYDAQVRLIEDEIVGSGYFSGLSNIDLRIGSVDRFQGMEEDIIIISFVRNNGYHNIGFAKDSRRINVALSRAKELLVIVGCSENFADSSDITASGMFKEILEYARKLDGIRNPAELKEIEFSGTSRRKYEKISTTTAEYSDNEVLTENVSDKINILDYFLLKSAYEFKNIRLTVNNISNVLGIAPVFIKSRTAYLASQGYISCICGVIKILDAGEKTITFFSKDTNKKRCK